MAGLYVAAGWLLVEVAGTLLPMFDAPAWIARTLVLVIALGLVPALAFAWVFEVTPDGLKRGDEVAPEASITRHTARRMDIALIVVVVALVGYIAADKLVLSPRRDLALVAATQASIAAKATEVPDRSIAVLPFRNEGGNQDDLYFSDGLSEDLITALSKFTGLKVIARDSAFRFRDSKEDSKAIAAQLGVAHLLSGSVRRLGDVVRISATLVDASDGRLLWSQRYDRPYKDLFALQDDITAAVSGALQIRLLARPASGSQSDRPPSGNLEAYDAVLRGNYDNAKRNREATERAITAFSEAIRLDPAYAYAHARRARVRASLLVNYGNAEITRASIAGIQQDVATALRLDPDSAEAHASEAYVQDSVLTNPQAALPAARRAVALAPQSASAQNGLGIVLGDIGRLEEAAAAYRRALELDPLSASASNNLGMVLLGQGRYAEAEAAYRASIQQQPEGASTRAMLALTQVLQGRASDALATARQESDEYWRTYALALAYWSTGDHARSDEALQTLIRQFGDWASSQVAIIHGQRRQPDQLFQWARRAMTRNESGAMNDPGVMELITNPFVIRYRDDPRFVDMTKALGQAPVYPSTGAANPPAP